MRHAEEYCPYCNDCDDYRKERDALRLIVQERDKEAYRLARGYYKMEKDRDRYQEQADAFRRTLEMVCEDFPWDKLKIAQEVLAKYPK